MNRMDYLLPEMKYMVRLLKFIEKYTTKIEKEKGKLAKTSIENISKVVEKIQSYNIGRFSAICLYQDVCQSFYDDEKNFTYSLYQERFEAGYVRACFMDEINCLSIIKNMKIPGWNCQPDSPDFSFNLNYYILETLGFGFDANFVRNCMDFFVSDNKVLEQYRKGTVRLFEQKKQTMAFSDAYKKSEFDDLFMAISSVFSMKVGPNDYNPFFEPFSLDELEKNEEKKKKENIILKLTKEELERFDAKSKLDKPGKER